MTMGKSVFVIPLLVLIVLASGCVQQERSLLREQSVISDKFIFHDSEGPNAGGKFSRELGVNTIPIYLDDWSRLEPADDQWNWDGAFSDNVNEYDHSMLRIGILHVLAWNPEGIPSWVDKNDLNGKFKEEYGEFVAEAVRQAKMRNISVDIYLVELESNFAGHEIGNRRITNAWIIEWIKWEAELIKSADSNAKIVVPLTPTEFRPKESLDNTGDFGKILVADFVGRMMEANVSFNAFGFNVASGFYDKIDDWGDLKAALDKWSTIDKEIFVWAMGYPADNIDNLSFNYPRKEGYSEEWQKEQYLNSLQILLENPKVIGVSIDLYDYPEAGQNTPVHWGLVGGDRAKPETLFKRQSFDAVKEYWNKTRR
ncbi:MAG: hypothetical protein V1839_04235 [archaeon]